MGFTADDRVRHIAEAYASDAIDFARQHFRVKLDYSDRSVQRLEGILDTFHQQRAAASPSEDQIMQFAKMFGSYVGEVFRRNHGATWGTVTLGEESFPGMQAFRTQAEFWPWGRVRNRLVNGPEDNVWHYFQVLIQRDGNPTDPEQEQISDTPWWRRLLKGRRTTR